MQRIPFVLKQVSGCRSKLHVRTTHCISLATVTKKWFSYHSNAEADEQKQVNERLHREAMSIAEKVRSGNRGVLASSITLMETEHKGKKKLAKKLLQYILSHSYDIPNKSLRIGISGPPGAGKSTFIEFFGKYLTSMGNKLAVLAVDPSSATTGGSLLGDKTRMPELTKDQNAYIRPSPARGHLGGVTRSTNESIILCEHAGYNIIIVETVGVGQSEYAVTNMVDVFILLLPPGGGDELQGIKRGIVERADIIVVTKADGDLEAAAHRAQYEYMASLKYMRPKYSNWKPKVMQVSSRAKMGIDKFWNTIQDFRTATDEHFLSRRAEQRVIWVWTHVHDGLREMILEDPRIKNQTDKLIEQVRLGKENPGTAADKILDSVMSFMK
ncbi:Methylmalonic aciduria type A protein, mitochondrial [Orchesella cincta]|uniref:Methylmalonic aciduria type A protein, mitochondrial n=1 Tax=Orchesella cincta TaxID=48709 RepID=A0A1D2NG35_ORCCI|nr:Methylmalonic aciduria type A protein, mitochondrial [Orchesella cincta]